MNKTVSINIGNIAFTIDEDAYFKLRNYLKTIEGYFKESDGRAEIMADIESRIAEMLSERMTGPNQIVSIKDIEAVIAQMGQPEDFLDDEAREEANFSGGWQQAERERSGTRRIYRDTDGEVIAGVCSGIGYYFGVDPVWLRIGFLVATFLGIGAGLIIYIVLWIVLPPARTSAEKLEMRGEPVNFQNIGKVVEEEMDNLRDKFNEFSRSEKKSNARGTGRRAKSSGVSRFVASLGNFIVAVIRGITKIIGVAFIGAGIAALIVTLIYLFRGDMGLIYFNSDGWVRSFDFSDFGPFIFEDSDQNLLALIAVGALIVIPIIGLILAGIRFLFGRKQSLRIPGIALTVLWIAAVLICVLLATQVAEGYSEEGETWEKVPLTAEAQDTLILRMGEVDDPGENYWMTNENRDVVVSIDDDEMMLGHVSLELYSSGDSLFSASVVKASQGTTRTTAEDRAEKINYKYSQDSTTLVLDPIFTIRQDDRYRVQRVRVELRIPEGKTVLLAPGVERILERAPTEDHWRLSSMQGHYWTMTPAGLKCTDCPSD